MAPSQTTLAPPKASGYSGSCSRGCLITIGVILIPYLLNALCLAGGKLINQAKWDRKGSPNYIISVEVSALVPYQGENIISVKEGKIVSTETQMCQQCDPDEFQPLTIAGLFETIGPECISLFPLFMCWVSYNPQYGYPEKIEITCLIGFDCSMKIAITQLQLSP